MSALPLTEVRARAAAALAPASEADPVVLEDLVDSVQPPALMLIWNDPWLMLRTVAGGQGIFEASLTVLCLAGRVEPGPGIETLEQLVSHTLGRLQADAYSWPLQASQAPRVFEIGNIPLLGARLTFRVPVSMNGGGA
jgi:hypothetical protein